MPRRRSSTSQLYRAARLSNNIVRTAIDQSRRAQERAAQASAYLDSVQAPHAALVRSVADMYEANATQLRALAELMELEESRPYLGGDA